MKILGASFNVNKIGLTLIVGDNINNVIDCKNELLKLNHTNENKRFSITECLLADIHQKFASHFVEWSPDCVILEDRDFEDLTWAWCLIVGAILAVSSVWKIPTYWIDRTGGLEDTFFRRNENFEEVEFVKRAYNIFKQHQKKEIKLDVELSDKTKIFKALQNLNIWAFSLAYAFLHKIQETDEIKGRGCDSKFENEIYGFKRLKALTSATAI